MALTDTRRPQRAARTPGRSPRRVRPASVSWQRTLLVAAALAAALASLHVVLQDISWWLVGTLSACVVLFAAAAARRVLRARVWPPIVSAVAGVALLTLIYAADTAILGVVPTLGTLGRFGVIIEQGITSIVEQRVPATPELGIVLLLAVLMMACAWVADAVVAARKPALVALPLAAILVVPIAIKPGLVDAFWYLVTAGLYLAILRIGRPRDSRRAVVVGGVVVALGSLLLPFAIPGVEEEPSRRTSGLRSGINPLITLGDDLRRGNPTLALSYTSSANYPVYLRLTTLERFTGETWGPIVGDDRGQGLEAFPRPTGLTEATPVNAAEVDVTVADVVTNWLPTPYPTTSITGVEGDWFWEPNGLTVRSVSSGARGQRYTATFLEPRPTSEQLASTAVFPADAPPDSLALPGDMPAIIAATAHQVADGAASAYDKALALQSYLRSTPFSYSEEAPVDEGFDGTGMEALAVFLERKTGYCVHYASAMAVMARELGIPARIAVGFQPGDRRFNEGSNVFEVSTDDLHAWPELYFDGVGWLRFEPTPGRGAVPRYGSELVDDPTTPQDESSPTPLPTSTADAAERPDVDGGVPGAAEAGSQLLANVARGVAIVAVVLLLLLLPAAARVGLRMLRLRRIRQGRDPAAAAWDEVRDTARDVGWSASETETPRVFAQRLAPELSGDALLAFRGSVEASAYGPPDAAPLSGAALAEVRRSILRSVDLRTRLRAFLLPPSLVHRWRPDGDA
ncbi:MAG: transglutaminaseTgpA domain-containing protein [Protaetiibacter sp.]